MDNNRMKKFTWENDPWYSRVPTTPIEYLQREVAFRTCASEAGLAFTQRPQWRTLTKQMEAAIAVLKQAERWEKLMDAANHCDQELCYQYLKEIEDGSKANAQLMAIMLALPALPEPPEGGKAG